MPSSSPWAPAAGWRHTASRPLTAASAASSAASSSRDRKSTRLNSSHVKTSYAVFCLKKKKGVHGHVVVFEMDHYRVADASVRSDAHRQSSSPRIVVHEEVIVVGGLRRPVDPRA